jgi:xylitol oxidase
MNKRTFLKLLSAIVARPVVTPLSAWMAKQKLTNWAGNLSYSTDHLREAASVEQIQSVFWSRYERMKEFIELATKYDPKGKFRNDFLNTYVFAR